MQSKKLLSMLLVMMMLTSSIGVFALAEDESVLSQPIIAEETVAEAEDENLYAEDYKPAALFSINDNPTSGTANSGKISWSLSGNGMLTISGNGFTGDFKDAAAPWSAQSQYIKFIYISDGITNIGTNAFKDLSDAQSVYIPESVTTIGISAFENCSKLKEISLPKNLRTIGASAFSNCTKIKNITIPRYVTSVGEKAFAGCEKLKEISVDKNNRAYIALDGVLFYDNGTILVSYPAAKNDNEYTISSGINVTTIADYAFYGSDKLEKVNFPSTLKTIGKGAFTDCESLTRVYIPASVTDIAQDAFLYGCDSLEGIDVDENNSVYSSEMGVLFNKDKTKLIRFPAACEEPCNSGEYVTPKTVKIIGQEAFLDCQTVEVLWMHGLLEKIEMAAFMNFDSLQEIWFDGTTENWEMVEIEPFNEKLDEVYIDCMVGTLEEKAFNAKVGVTYHLEEYVNIEGNEDVLKTLVVSSSNTSVATVDVENKTLTAISDGEAIITAVAIKDGVSYAVSVKVIVSSDITDKEEGKYSLVAGDTLDLKKALTVPEIFLNSLTWNTSNSKVVTVNNGVITAVGKGSAVVIATVNDPSMSAYSIRCEINVEPKYTDEKYFKFSNGTITDYTGTDTEVIIPPTINGIEVKAIGNNAFTDCYNVTKIELPESVYSIGNYAFYNCTSLSNINMHEGITHIGTRAFNYCSSLVKITIPSKADCTSAGLFEGCSRLNSVTFANGIKTIYPILRGSSVKNVVIPGTVTKINGYAFYGCSNLSSISIPNSVTSIGIHAFSNCYNLKTVSMGKNVTTIGAYAFKNASKLTSVNLSAALTTLEYGAFSYCTSLTGITIPDKVSFVESDLFYGCTGLKTVKLGAGVKAIGSAAFYDCGNLESINLPNGLLSIGYSAFYKSGLKSVTIPNTVTSIELHAFHGCTNLATVSLSSGLTAIKQYTFAASGLTSITIPDNVKTIDNYAFTSCNNLQTVQMGKNVATVAAYAFKNCKNLKNVNLPNSLKKLGYNAFGYTGLTSVIMPDSVTTIEDNVFYGCSSLTDVTLGKGFEKISYNLFSGCSSIKNVTLSEGIKTIMSGAFRNCSNLEKINLPDSLTSIGDSAFWGCSKLKEVKFGNNLKSIDYQAFGNCHSLQSINIPDSVTSLSNNVFYNCTSLKDVTSGKGIKSIPNYAFYYCKSLESITIPDNVTTIGEYAFAVIKNLKNINFGNGVTRIKYAAFVSCDSIESLHLPENIAYVEGYAFAYCYNLEKLQIDNPYCSFGYNVFYDCFKLNGSSEWSATYKALSEEYVGYFPMQIEYNISGTLISNKKITVNLPTGSYLVEGSMELDGEPYTNYDADKEYRVTIPVENNSGTLTFCIKPDTYGTISTSASMSYTSISGSYTKQIGQVYLSMPEITVNSVDTTGKADVIVEGMALPREQINLYVQDVYQKTVKATSTGTYKTTVTLDNPENYKDYKITAEVFKNKGTNYEQRFAADKTVKYVGNTPNLEGLIMYYGQNGYKKETYDLYNTKTRPVIRWGDYWYGKNGGNYSYSFAVDISQRDNIDKVYVVSSRSGKKEYLEAVWSAYSQKYVTSGFFAGDCEYIPGTLTVEYTKVDSKEKFKLSDIATYLDFEAEAFRPSIMDYTSETFGATVSVSDALKEVFGDEFNITSETVEVDFSYVTDEELYPDIVDFYSYPVTYNNTEYVLNFDCTDASNAIIYVNDLTNGTKTRYTISFSKTVDENITENIMISDILDKLEKYSGKILDIYNINVNTNELNNAARLLDVNQADMDIALKKAEELELKKQMFVLSSIVLSASSIENVSAPTRVLDCILGAINEDIEYFEGLKLLGLFKIGSECKIRWLIDPSGYVYEGVTDNRLEGVTATIYYVPADKVPEKAMLTLTMLMQLFGMHRRQTSKTH